MPELFAWSTSSFLEESPRRWDVRAAGFDVRANPHGRTLTGAEARAHLDGVVGVVAGTEKLTGELLRQLHRSSASRGSGSASTRSTWLPPRRSASPS